MLGKTEGRRRRGRQRMRCLDAITDLMDVNWSKLWKMLRGRGAWCAAVLGVKTVRHGLAAAQQHLHLGPSQAEVLFLAGEGPFLIQIHKSEKKLMLSLKQHKFYSMAREWKSRDLFQKSTSQPDLDWDTLYIWKVKAKGRELSEERKEYS